MRNLSDFELSAVGGGLNGELTLSLSYNTLAALGIGVAGAVVGATVIAGAGLCYFLSIYHW